MKSAIVITKYLRREGNYFVFHYYGYYEGRKVREIYVYCRNNRVKLRINEGYILHLEQIRVVCARIIGRLVRAKIIQGDEHGRIF